jgi:hypothetical protein
MNFGFGMRLTPLAGFGPVLSSLLRRGFCLQIQNTNPTCYLSRDK